jgi:hypothetical protein
VDSIERLADRIETLPLAVRQALVGTIQTFGEFLLDYNRNYLLAGEKPDGSPIDAGGYSPAYAAYRRKYGLQTAVKDLKFTGDYAKAFRLDYQGGLSFEIGNLDPKAAKLLTSYGELYGVREEDIIDFIQVKLKPEIEQVIYAHMHAL